MPARTNPSRRSVPVRSAAIFCEVCGETTTHRILQWMAAGPGSASGTARCGTCHWTHPFLETAPELREVWVVRSRGARSERARWSVSATRTLEVGAPLPEDLEGYEIRRLEDDRGRSRTSAIAREVRTIWAAVPARGIDVSVIDGRETTPTTWEPGPGAIVTIGDRLNVDGEPTFVIGFRGRNRTWRRSGDSLPASEVSRIYARRTRSPPGGSSRWSRSRSTPNSRDSSRSRSIRPRSSSGDR